MKVIGQIYLTGKSENIQTMLNAEETSTDAPLESGLFCIRDADDANRIALVDGTGICIGVTGLLEGNQVGVVKSGTVCVQQTSGQTPAIGGQVKYDETTGKASTASTSNETAINATYVSEIEDCILVDAYGNQTVVKGALIEINGTV